MKKCKLEFILTYKCNYNCSYCYQKEDRKNQFNISLKNFEIYIKFFKKFFNKLNITLMGGELSINDNYLKYFNYLNQNPQKIYKINFTTNFSNPEFIYKLYKFKNIISLLEINITKHIGKEINIDKLLELDKNERIILNYFKEDKYFNVADLKNKVKNIIFIERSINNEIFINNFKKICLPYFFKIDKRGIYDFCRNQKYKNLLNLKRNLLNLKSINCQKQCNFCDCEEFLLKKE